MVMKISWCKNFIHRGKSRAGLWSAGDHVDRSTDDRRAEAMAGRRHRRPTLPTVFCRIVGFDFAVGTSARLAAKDEGFAVKNGGGYSTSNRREPRTWAPAIRNRIVFFIGRDTFIMPAIDSPADGVKLTVDNADGVMIARCGQRCTVGPEVLHGIVFFIGTSISTVAADATDGENFSRDQPNGQRAAGRR